MKPIRYNYENGICGFFEFPTENARKILPPYLQPAELRHGVSIFSMTCFDFTDTIVGPYGEIVMSVLVAHWVDPAERLAKAAMYPYLVATTTKAARVHAIRRWRLPHWMTDIAISFEAQGTSLTAKITVDDTPVADLVITGHAWKPVSHLYQCFINQRDAAFVANVVMNGQESEHEEETGSLVLYDHPFNRQLDISEIRDVPFREVWMKKAVEIFHPLIPFDTRLRRPIPNVARNQRSAPADYHGMPRNVGS